MYFKSLAALTAIMALNSSSFAMEKMEDILVTAKTNKSINDLAGSVVVITAEDIKKANASSIKDILIQTAGVIPIMDSGSSYGRQNVSIRGSESRHVLILVDGKKISGLDPLIGHSDFQYNWVPMDSIERIEVIKGPMSSIYGSEAIGGVINIITKEQKEPFSGDIGIKVGKSSGEGGDSKEISTNIGGMATKKLSIILSAEKKDQDVATKDGGTYIEGKKITNGTLKVKYDIDDSQILKTSYLAGTEKRYTAGDTLYYDIDKKAYDLSYLKDFGKTSLDLTYYVVDSDTHYDSATSTIYSNTQSLTNKTAKGEIKTTFINNNYIVFGAENKVEEYDKIYDESSSSSNNFSGDITTNSVFAQDEIELGDKFILTLGMRYDDHEKFGSETSPKANIVYKLTSNQRLKFGYGEGFNAPTVNQNSSSYALSHSFTYYSYKIIGNDDLKPETSKSFELGYEYFSDNINFKTTIFRTKVKNLITYTSQGYSNGYYVYEYNNVDNVTMSGIESEFNYDIDDTNNIKINHTYLDAHNDDDSEKLTYRPKRVLNIFLNSQLPYNIKSSFNINYTGEQYDGSDDVGGYTTSNLQLSKDITKDLNVEVGANNLFDKEVYSGIINLTGRFTYIGLKYKF